MGHNLGMVHDMLYDGYCNNKGCGIMHYGSCPNVWSTCSKESFLEYYNRHKSEWCMDGTYQS